MVEVSTIRGQGHPDVDRSWGRTLRRCLLVWAEGHAARERPQRPAATLLVTLPLGGLYLILNTPLAHALIAAAITR